MAVTVATEKQAVMVARAAPAGEQDEHAAWLTCRSAFTRQLPTGSILAPFHGGRNETFGAASCTSFVHKLVVG